MSEREMPFLDHLEEFRWRIIKALISIVLLTVISFYFSDYVLEILLQPVKKAETQVQVDMQVLKIQAIFIIKLEIALIIGILLSLPVILYQLWAFVSPGLYSNEKKYIWPIIFFSMVSFAGGISFAYFLIIPYALTFFLGLSPAEISNNIAIDFYFGFVLRILLVFGIVFQLPVVSVLLTKLGLITPTFLRKYRRYSIVVFFVFAAVLTPPDPTTQVMLAIPLIILYEITILLSYVFHKKKQVE